MADNLLQLQAGTKSYGYRHLFQGATFSVNEGEHLGVIGPNGAGKSTLFHILSGKDTLDSGQIVRSRQLTLGYLSQHDEWRPEETGNTYLERVSRIPLWDLKPQGRTLQLSEELLERSVLSLSGGYRMRIKLLGLLGQQPNLMLLDEPTNYLDLETTLVLEHFLQDFRGAFLLISHDREFLRRTTDHILEIEAGEMTKYNGNIDDYFEQKELLRTQTMASASTQQKKRQDILDFVARFGAKATKAKQAQSRLKLLGKMEMIEVKPLPVTSVIRIPQPAKTGKVVLGLQNASFGYGEKMILKDVNLNIMRGDHVAVVGLNGAGKSTLLKGISGALKPVTGTHELGMGVEMALFAQHVIEALDPAHNVLQSLESAAHPMIRTQEVLDLAGSLLFSGDDVKKSITMLSGGEKSRVALGRVLLRKAPCLVLDEPTNHLDFSTVEALTNALRAYEGTVIVVSHDRGFVKRVGTKILEVSKGGVRLYPGSYEEYVWSVQQDISRETTAAPAAKSAVKADEPRAPNWKEEKKRLDRELRSCEKRLQECEKELHALQAETEELNHKIAAEVNPSMEWVSKMSANGARIEELELLWLQLAGEKEAHGKALSALVGG